MTTVEASSSKLVALTGDFDISEGHCNATGQPLSEVVLGFWGAFSKYKSYQGDSNHRLSIREFNALTTTPSHR